MDRYAALQAMERMDPDGGEREPTEADYAAFEAWCVASFGRELYEEYARGGWGRESDY